MDVFVTEGPEFRLIYSAITTTEELGFEAVAIFISAPNGARTMG